MRCNFGAMYGSRLSSKQRDVLLDQSCLIQVSSSVSSLHAIIHRTKTPVCSASRLSVLHPRTFGLVDAKPPVNIPTITITSLFLSNLLLFNTSSADAVGTVSFLK